MQEHCLFSRNLIVRTQAYFSKKYALSISVEETENLLGALADLYEVYAGLVNESEATQAAAQPPLGDLLIASLNKTK